MIHYVVFGSIESGKSNYDLLVDESHSRNYSSYVNHSLSVLKQSAVSIDSNKKQPSSFGNWFTITHSNLCLIVLTSQNYGDEQSLSFLKELASKLEAT